MPTKDKTDFFGAKIGTEKADDYLFAMQAYFGLPKEGYEYFQQYRPDQLETALKWAAEKEIDKFKYFEDDAEQYVTPDLGVSLANGAVFKTRLGNIIKIINSKPYLDTRGSISVRFDYEYTYEGKTGTSSCGSRDMYDMLMEK